MPTDPPAEAPVEVPAYAAGEAGQATSWADVTTHEALLVIAEGITQLAGFGVAAVSVVRDRDPDDVAGRHVGAGVDGHGGPRREAGGRMEGARLRLCGG